MAEHEEAKGESVIEEEEIQNHDDSSSSDSDDEKSAPSEVKAKIYRLFGRERPVHHVLGGGKPADVFLWRNKYQLELTALQQHCGFCLSFLSTTCSLWFVTC
ncbi:hypothetical protein SAY87_011235 [Trapa incisa]|uniref:Uncharacterized protein n=1 Tax=Trapa incisa TaxID=236973 RepID=A0AAN7JJ17_9MYRT|nr:hypothetical protein SAY87_011235 [Trapa incisa]